MDRTGRGLEGQLEIPAIERPERAAARAAHLRLPGRARGPRAAAESPCSATGLSIGATGFEPAT